MKKRKLYLLLSRFPDCGSKVIEALTGFYYTHASIGLDEDLNTFYSFVTKGFIVESIPRYLKPDREPFPCQLYELEVPESTYLRAKEILEYFICLKQLLGYTKLGVVLSILRIPYRKNRFKFFCTQFVADVLRRSGAVKLKKKSHYCFAKDLKQLPGMKLKYQGDMRSMLSLQKSLCTVS